MPDRLRAALWLVWCAFLAWLTADIFRWHLDYFRSPGSQFYRLALVFIPSLAALAWIYSILRQRGLWKWEPHALLSFIALACLFYELRASIVVSAVFLACSAAGGFAFRRMRLTLANPLERIALSFGAGAGFLIPLLFVCGLLRLFYAPVFLVLLGIPLLLFWKEAWRTLRDVLEVLARWRSSRMLRHPLAGVAVVFAFIAAACALMISLAPSIAFDAVAVHLPSVQFYAQTHALKPVTGLEYSYYPQGFEMLWTFAYALAGQPGAQLMSALFFPLFLAILICLACRCGLDAAACLIAAVCTATLPFLHWSASVMKNDLALAFFELLALYAFVCWLADRNFRWILAGSFFLAQAFSVKHVALFGAFPLVLLFSYAIRRQPKRAPAAAAAFAIFLAFGAYWTARTYLLTGNPVAPSGFAAAMGCFETTRPTFARRVKRVFRAPSRVLFHGLDAFESPLPNPAGILFLVFAPLALLGGGIRPKTDAQRACLVFAAFYLLYWSATLIIVRYAIAPFALLALLAAAWMKSFYDASNSRLARLSLIGAETYALLISLMGLLIVGINAPQLAYFAGRLDRPGYLRAAMRTYGAVEFLNRAPRPAGVFAVDNFARAYAPDPFHYQAIWCPDNAPCSTAGVVQNARRSAAGYLILPENGQVPPDALQQLGSPQRLYRDEFFSVYRLPRNAGLLLP